MTQAQQAILQKIKDHLTQNPEIRFGQALFNLGINEFADKHYPEIQKHQLRDIHNDKDEDILNRVERREVEIIFG